MTSKAEKLLQEARDLLGAAEEKEAAADADKWGAAERMWKAHREEGLTHAQIGRVMGFSIYVKPNGVEDCSTSNRYVSIWERYGQAGQPDTSFTEAWYAVSGQGKSGREERAAERVLREADRETVEKVVAALPPERQAVIGRAAMADQEAAEKVVAALPPERQAAVGRAAIRRSADDVMSDPQTRMRARAAAERQSEAARAQAESERKAEASALRDDTQDVIDGRALTELGGALGRIVGTTRAAAEVWRRWEPKVSSEAREAAIDDIGGSQARVDEILNAMRGAGLDEALARILAESAEE